MSDLKKSISKAIRGPRPTKGSQWVTTFAENAWCDDQQRYVEQYSEGYWYDGPWALAHNVSPIWTAVNFRWRNDDGSESTATWLKAEDVAAVKADGVQPGHNVRLRVNFGETNGAQGSGEVTGSWTLQFLKNAETWTTIGAATDVKYYNSANLTNGTELATQRLTDIGETYQSTASDENEDGVTPSFGPWSNDSGEAEFSIQFDATNSAEDDVFQFRLLDPESNPVTFTTVPTITLAGLPPKTADGSPSITPITADGTAKRELPADGSPSISAITADGSATREVPSDGSPSIGNVTSDGSATIVGDGATADGAPSITPITADGEAERIIPADGSPSITPITADGEAEVIQTADGAPSITPITADGQASIIREASGGPSISPITAEGVSEIIREATGSPSISPITAAGNSFIWPKVYLNTTETLVGATEMTISSVDIDGTSITFDDSVGPPVGSLFLGVENRVNGDVGWIAVTVTEAVGPTIVFGGFGA